jgi:hypothetical protein
VPHVTFFRVGFSLAARHHAVPPPSDLQIAPRSRHNSHNVGLTSQITAAGESAFQ